MTRADHAIQRLAERLNLEPAAARYLPTLVSNYAERLKMTTEELIDICPLAPSLMMTITKECRSNVKG
jgi:hypothetical protein